MKQAFQLFAVIFAVLIINGCVGGNFIHTDDQDLYGKADHWAYPVNKGGLMYGDCEDYAIMHIVDRGRGELLIVEPDRQWERDPLSGMYTRSPLHAVALIDGQVFDVNKMYMTPTESDYTVLERHSYEQVMGVIQ